MWGEGRALKKKSLDELALVGKRTQDDAGPRRPKGQRLLTSVKTLIDKASVPGSRFCDERASASERRETRKLVKLQ